MISADTVLLYLCFWNVHASNTHAIIIACENMFHVFAVECLAKLVE